jgi:putative DNA primase/helicase
MKTNWENFERDVLKGADRVTGAKEKPRSKAKQKQHEPRPDIVAPAFSDDALALQFADDHADDLRYVAAWSRWLSYDGSRWQFDDTLKAFDLARKICRATAARCNKPKIATLVTSAKTVAAVERLAKADRRIAATVDQFDADQWLLNTPGGVVDLRNGKICPHRADDYLSKITNVAPDSNCSISLWKDFLQVVTNKDNDLIGYLQRLSGYSLTGITIEHILAFLWGTGANGKSTFIDAITQCLGDYHRTAPIEAFTATYSDRHPTDLAGLRGARLVTAVETEEGRHWAESKIKTLTGGDKISARFMRQDFFEYVPQFKLVIAGNHKPGLRSVDEAIRRRFNLIPFTVTIPPEKRDRELGQKLKAEWPGILAWMVQGCIDWQQCGLAPPKVVTTATEAYLESQDAIAAWMDDQCDLGPNAWENSQMLFASWKSWAERSGEYAGNTKTFRERLEVKGVHPKRQAGTGQRGYQGIALKPFPKTDEEPYWKR